MAYVSDHTYVRGEKVCIFCDLPLCENVNKFKSVSSLTNAFIEKLSSCTVETVKDKVYLILSLIS